MYPLLNNYSDLILFGDFVLELPFFGLLGVTIPIDTFFLIGAFLFLSTRYFIACDRDIVQFSSSE